MARLNIDARKGAWQSLNERNVKSNVVDYGAKYEVADQNGNILGTVSYAAKEAIEKNKLDSYKPKNDEEKRVIDSLLQESYNNSPYGKLEMGLKAKKELESSGKNVYLNDNVYGFDIKKNGDQYTVVPKTIKGIDGAFDYMKSNVFGTFNKKEDAEEYAGKLKTANDFIVDSKYVSTAKDNVNDVKPNLAGFYDDTGFEDIKYDYINKNKTAISRQQLLDIQSDSMALGLDESFLKEMTSDEIAVFNYIYKNMGKDEAYNYIDSLKNNLTGRQRQNLEGVFREMAQKNPIRSSVFTVLASPTKGISYLGQLADYLNDGKIDQNAGYNKFSYTSSATRDEVSKMIEDSGKWGKVGSWGYQLGMSYADMLMNSAVTGGNKALSLALMGTGAAADSVISAKDRGLSDNQAFALGTISGAVEILTEKMGWDNLFEKNPLEVGIKKYIVGNMISEGAEEGTATLANYIADLIISKDKSEWSQDIKKYTDAGDSKAVAMGKAAGKLGLQTLIDAAGGALMGGAGASGLTVPRYIAANNSYTTSMTEINDTIDKGLSMDENSDAYKNAVKLRQKQNAKNRGETKNGVSDYEIQQQKWQNYKQTATTEGKNLESLKDEVIKTGLESPKDSDAYKNAKTLSKKKNVSDFDLGEQYFLNVEQTNKESEQKFEVKYAPKNASKNVKTFERTLAEEGVSDIDMKNIVSSAANLENSLSAMPKSGMTLDKVIGANQILTKTITNSVKNKLPKTSGINTNNITEAEYWQIYSKNIDMLSAKNKTIDEKFVNIYTKIYSDALASRNSMEYNSLLQNTGDVAKTLENYVLTGTVPGSLAGTNIVEKAGENLKDIISSAVGSVASAHKIIYGQNTPLAQQEESIRKGDFSSVKSEDVNQASNVSLAMLNTFKPGAMERIAEIMEKETGNFNIERFSAKLTEYYQKNGNINPFREFFTDGGIAVTRAMEGITEETFEETEVATEESAPIEQTENVDKDKPKNDDGVDVSILDEDVSDAEVKEKTTTTEKPTVNKAEEVKKGFGEAGTRAYERVVKTEQSLHSPLSEYEVLREFEKSYRAGREGEKNTDGSRLTEQSRKVAEKAGKADRKSETKKKPKYSVVEGKSESQTKKTNDAEYMDAVENGDLETAQKMVDEEAKRKGYNSPKLYHGTNSFGFTEFDLSKMDDKRTIFLTNNKRIASTYSGVSGERKISDVYNKDIEKLDTENIAKELNKFVQEYYKDTFEFADYNYSYYNLKKLNDLINVVNDGLVELTSEVEQKIAEYANKIAFYSDDANTKIYKQLVSLKERLDKWDYNNLSTPIYLLIHHTDVFADNSAKYGELEANIRLMNDLRKNENISDGVVVEESLGRYSIEVMSKDDAVSKLKDLEQKGNYALYAKMSKPLIIDGRAQNWNNIRRWSDGLISDKKTFELADDDEFYYLKNKETGQIIKEASVDILKTSKMSSSETIDFLINKYRNILAIKYKNVKTTREIAKVAKDMGYDSVVIKNITDNGGRNYNVGMEETADIYILFDSNNVKSADPITYDEKGNVIPLSERFDKNNMDIRYSIDSNFITEYDKWVKDGRPYRKNITVGRTSEALKSIGVKEQKIVWDTSKINESLTKHQYLNDTILKQIPNLIESPVIVMQSKKSNSRITMFGEVYDNDGLPVMAVLELQPKNRAQTLILDEIKVVSTHSRKTNDVKSMAQTQNLINSSEILYVEPDKKRTDNWLSLNRLQLPLSVTNYGSIKSITYPEWDVNTYSMQKNENFSMESVKGDKNNGQVRENLLSGDSERGRNESSRKQAEKLSKFKQEVKGKEEAERKSYTKELRKQGLTEEKVSVIEIDGERVAHKYNLIKPENYNDDMKAIVKEAEAKGKTVGFFAGNAICQFDGQRDFLIDGIKVSDTEILLQYDGVRPPQQLLKHEEVHTEWDSDEVQAAKDEILNDLTDAEKDSILSEERYEHYMEIYDGDVDAVWEEFVADTMAGMNDYTERYIDIVDSFWHGEEGINIYTPAEYTNSIDTGGKIAEESGKYSVDNSKIPYNEKINAEYLELAKNPEQNEGKLREMVDEAAIKAGFPTKVYHGTNKFGFTKNDVSKSDDGISFFATDSLDLASTYSGVIGETSIKKGNSNNAENQQRYDGLVKSFVDTVNEVAGTEILTNESLPFDKYLNRVKKGKMNSVQLSQAMTNYTADIIEQIEEHTQLNAESDSRIWDISNELEVALYGLNGAAGNYGLYANTNNFFEIDGNGSQWSSIPFDKIPSKTTANTREIVKWAKDNGYSGVLFKNIYDIGYHGKTQKNSADVYAFFKPQEQTKSADPVTYDAFGRVIPLSKRFNTKNKDIRYSEKDTAPTKKTVKKTSEQIYREQNKAIVQYIKDEYDKSEKFTPRIEDVRKAANRLGKGYIGDKKLAQEIGRIYKDVKSAIAYAEKPGVTEQDIQAKWNVVQEEVDDLAMDIVMNHQEKNDANWQMIKDLRDYMRGRTIKVPAENKGDFDAQGGLEELRKHNMGRFYISQTKGESMEALYPELRGMFGNLLPDISNPSDQLIALSDLYDEMAVTFDNPYDADIEAAQQSMSLEIMADMLVNIKEVGNDVKNKRIETLYKVLQTEREKRYSALKRVKDRQDKKIREVKEKAKAAKERKADITARQRLLAVAKRLDSLSKKSKPEQQAEIQKLIGHLDLAAVSITKRNIDKLENIKSVYEEMKLNPDFVEDKHIERLIARLGKKQISDLDLQDVQTLTDVLLGIEHKIRTDGRDIDTADKRKISIQAEETMRNIDNSSGSAAMGIGKFADNLVTGVLTPTREARRITGYVDNDPLYIKMKSMQKGQVDMFDYQMKAEKMFEKFTNDTRFMESITGAKAKTKTYKVSEKNSKGEVIGERNIELTPGMKISLLLHNINSSNQGHMKIGGVTIPNVKLYKAGKIDEAFARGEKIYLHPSDIRAITADLTPQEREYAKLVYKYYNEFAKNEVNRVSVKLKGYEIAKVKDYFPIETNRDFSRQDFELVNVDGTIEGMGFLKERTQAKNPILLRDVASILEQSIRMNSKYVGLAIPVRNMSLLLGKSFSKYGEATIEEQAVYGLNYTIEEGYYGSVMDSIEKKWGVNGKEYINKIMKDMQGAKKEQGWIEKSVEKIGSRYVRGILSWNPKVAFNQVASIPSAIPEVGVKALSRSMFDFGRVNTDRIAEYTPLQYMRSKGAYDTTIADMTRAKKGPLAAIDKVVDKVDMMTWTDTIMTRKLWKAAEYNIKYSRKDLKVGSQEYYEAVAEVYVDIMQNTQPNVSMMERPQFLRGDAVTRKVMSFKGEPFKNLNMMYESAGNLRAKTRQLKQLKNNKSATAKEISEAENRLKQAKSEFAVTMISQALASLVYGIEASIFQLLYGKVKDYWDDEEEKVTFGSWLVGVLKDSAINTVTQIPFADYVVDIVGSLSGGMYYSPFTPPALDSIDTVTKTIPALASAVQNLADGKMNLEQFSFKVNDAIEDIATFMGIPYANVVKNIKPIIKGVAKKISPSEYVGDYAALKLESAISENKENSKGEILTKGSSEAFDILYNAMKNGDKDSYDIIIKDMVERGISYKDIENAMQSRAKKDNNFDISKSLGMYAGVENQTKSEAYEKYIEKAEELGVSEDDLKTIVELANSNKKYQKRKKEAEAYIDGQGLDYVSKEFLMNIVADGYSVNDLDNDQYKDYAETRATYLETVSAQIVIDGKDEREIKNIYDKAATLAEEYALKEASDGEYEMRSEWMNIAVDSENLLGITTGEFLGAYEKYGTATYSTKALVTHKVGYNVNDYLQFRELTKDLKSDKDSNGKDIKGQSKQDKIINVLNNMDVSNEVKAYLYSMEYKSNKNNPWASKIKVNYKEYTGSN